MFPRSSWHLVPCSRLQARCMRLAGKNAFITGAASGVGQAVACLFAVEGADVVLLDRDQSGLDETRRQLSSTGRRTVSLCLDLSDTDVARKAIDQAEHTLGPIHVLVNCAGIAVVKPFLEVTEEEYD